MPSVKQFEYMSLTMPFKIDYMDMYQMAEHHYNQIKQLFKMIEKEKKENYYCCLEIPNDEDHWYIWKEGNRFVMENGNTVGVERQEFEPIEFYNWCFAKAPFFGMIGEGWHVPQGKKA